METSCENFGKEVGFNGNKSDHAIVHFGQSYFFVLRHRRLVFLEFNDIICSVKLCLF